VKPTSSQGGAADADAIVQITENQRQIMLRLFAGSTIDEIAADTGRRPSTIGNTVRRVREQLGARNDYDLFLQCLRHRFVKLSEIYALAERLRRARLSAGGPAGRRRGRAAAPR
jgi:DNA-binding CsgD family transcriptional regulator